ncbi:hypothetical protein AD947_16670 [Acetobacter tropicalis]|uniref:ABC transporter domain-containing protein n=1 Tax=Acetobacter tropicalis TaxID=104102 RepID=A0A149TR53_9PROT|nr:ATP-binding cassette domain-containing protein [Acetobacter tropicalis]KXV55607.1 hypothetical protein AD947_16670 [Acetobacter tropicalis]
MTDLLTAKNVSLGRTGPDRKIRPILDGVDLSVKQGETVAILGASGTGKSTLAHILAGLLRPSAGQILFKGVETVALQNPQNRQLRCNLQMIFQDPYSSLDPRQTVSAILNEPLLVQNLSAAEKQTRIELALQALALPLEALCRRAHEFSGGQRQRIAIARALVGQPSLIIADEAVSALDASIQARVLNVFLEQQGQTGLSLVFISHDMTVVRHIAHRVVVLAKGRVVEEGPTKKVFENSCSPYTRQLLQNGTWKDVSR